MHSFRSTFFCIIGSFLLLGFFIPILSLIISLYEKGKAALALSLLTEVTPPPGMHGGLLNALLGSFEMVGFAFIGALPIGIILANSLVLHKHKKWVILIQLMNDSLLSLP